MGPRAGWTLWRKVGNKLFKDLGTRIFPEIYTGWRPKSEILKRINMSYRERDSPDVTFTLSSMEIWPLAHE
jgi:hypothetical protein